jgi:excisionase family DNA binding protein
MAAPKKVNEVPICEKALLTVREAAAYANIGINRLSKVLNEPDCPFVFKNGKRRLVKRQELDEYIRNNGEL